MVMHLIDREPVRYSAIGSWEPGSEEWHGERMYRVGSSEIGAICGLSSFDTYYRAFHRKLGNISYGASNVRTRGGQRQEADVREEFAENHPDLKVTPCVTTYARDDRPWQMATPDGFVADESGMRIGIVEVKVTEWSNRDHWGDPLSADVPLAYYAQALWLLNVVGMRRLWFAVRFGAFGYEEFYIDLDLHPTAEADTALLVERGQEFIDRLEIGPWPLPDDGSDVTYQAVRERHPKIDGTEAILSPDMRDGYVQAYELKTAAEKNLSRWSALVLEQMDKAQHAVTEEGGQRFAYRTSRKTKTGELGTPYLMIDHQTKKRLSLAEAIAGEDNA